MSCPFCEERAGQSVPQPEPSGSGVLVAPSLFSRLTGHSALQALVVERVTFGLAKYGRPLHTCNGRDPEEDARQEVGDLLQYLEQASLEGRDIRPLLDLLAQAHSAFQPR